VLMALWFFGYQRSLMHRLATRPLPEHENPRVPGDSG
jgi:hypothetical protein